MIFGIVRNKPFKPFTHFAKNDTLDAISISPAGQADFRHPAFRLASPQGT
jgi:hypothetical protein